MEPIRICGNCRKHGYEQSSGPLNQDGEPDIPNSDVCYCDENMPACTKFEPVDPILIYKIGQE